PLPVVIDYITGHKDTFGVEPICRSLKEAGIKIAPSTYYARMAHTHYVLSSSTGGLRGFIT
ncbi:hypothetical protein NMM52_21285, partial [Acinetobacter baumannii]|nr:hypothetical protein [Acinetobacter baumannii]